MSKRIDFIKQHKFDVRRRCMTSPMFIHVEVTTKCPLSCSQCYVSEKSIEMDWNICKDVIHQAHELGVKQIMLTGGEPIIYSNLYECINLISSYNMLSVLSTSGVGVSDSICDKLIDAGIGKIFVSLNGSNEHIHNLSRSHFYDSLNALKLIKSKGIYCGINWVAREDNYNDFPNIFELAHFLGIDELAILSNKKNILGSINSAMNENSVKSLADIINSKCLEDLNITVDPCFQALTKYLSKTTVFERYCNAGRTFFDILVDGSVVPCRHLRSDPEKMCDLTNYWNDSRVLKQQRDYGFEYRICQGDTYKI